MAQPQRAYWKRLRYARHWRAKRVEGVTHALAFANSVSSWMWNLSALHDQTLHGLRTRHTAVVFCNHGGDAVSWYKQLDHRPALVEWFLHYNGVLRSINSCSVPAERERMSNATGAFAGLHRGQSNVIASNVLFHVLDNGQWREWHNENDATRLRSMADTCFAGLGGSHGVRFYTEASYERHLRTTYRLPYDYKRLRELSTGAVAALTVRLEYPARVRVLAVGYDGLCSHVERNSTRISTDCQQYHNFAEERSILERAGVEIVLPPRQVSTSN